MTTASTQAPATRQLASHKDLPLQRLGSADALHFDFLPGGHLHAARHGSGILLNLVLGCPLAGALHRVYVLAGTGDDQQVFSLIGPESTAAFSISENAAKWEADFDGLTATAIMSVSENGWQLSVDVNNNGDSEKEIQVVHGLDVGLAHQGAVRTNESYTSQYLDQRALDHADYGKVICTRQNLAVDGNHPWLAQTCAEGVSGFVTDAVQFFGFAINRGGAPEIFGDIPAADSRVYQGESSYVGLFAEPLQLAPAASGSRTFLFTYNGNHAAATDISDLESLVAAQPSPATDALADFQLQQSLLHYPAVAHGEDMSEDEVKELYPNELRMDEREDDGELLSFYHGKSTVHVATRAKEVQISRPHGIILRSGDSDYPEEDFLSTTCYGAGVINALTSIGHASFHRLYSVPRDKCGLMPSYGQRVWFQDADGDWNLLGVPSLFEMDLTACRWIYKLADRTIVVKNEVNKVKSEAKVDVEVIAGPETAFLVTSGLVVGINEYDDTATVEYQENGIHFECSDDSLAKKHFPKAYFQLDIDTTDAIAQLGGAEIIGGAASLPFSVIETKPAKAFAFTISGTARGEAPSKTEEQADLWSTVESCVRLSGSNSPAVERIDHILPWFAHNGLIHLTSPHGLEQYNGGAWGCRDVTQGSIELLLSLGRADSVKKILLEVYRHQYDQQGDWPQWFMLDPFGTIQQAHMHGDIPVWPLKAVAEYVEATEDYSILDEVLPWTNPDGFALTEKTGTLWEHLELNFKWIQKQCVEGTALISYGDGDWNDSLQPARPELKERMVSSWTVALCYQTISGLEKLCKQTGRSMEGLDGFSARIAADFRKFLIVDGTVCGFFLFNDDLQSGTPILHPSDETTGISYRLLPMTRSMIGSLFTEDEYKHHLGLIRENLLAPDGARLMDKPPTYRGGPQEIFQRAESAAAFSREIGIMYTHAHLRFIEAMAQTGNADDMLQAFEVVNPIGCVDTISNAKRRQHNVYFSSSDADVNDRYEAAEKYEDIKAGKVKVEGGWRVYSSGPGIYLNLLLTRLVGLRSDYGKVVIDPVVPNSLDGLVADTNWKGTPIKVNFTVGSRNFNPSKITLNGTELEAIGQDENPYREGGWVIDPEVFNSLLKEDGNVLDVVLG